MRKIALPDWFRTAAAFLLIGATAVYLWQYQHELQTLANLSLVLIAGVFMARLAAYVLMVASHWWITRQRAPAVAFSEYLLVSANGSALGTFGLPGTSYAIKTLYLKHSHGLGYADFFAVNLIAGLVTLTSSGLIALGGLTLLELTGGTSSGWIWLCAANLLVGPALLLGFSLRWLNYVQAKRFAQVKGTLTELLRDWSRLGPAFGGLALRGLISFLGFGFLFQSLSGNGLAAGGTVDALSFALRLVRVTPGNLGLYEWVVATFAKGLGATLAVGLLCALLYRVIGSLAMLTAGLLSRLAPRPAQSADSTETPN